MRVALAVVLAAVLAACAPASPEPPVTDRVSVVEPAGRPAEWGYAPTTIRVPSGTAVTWHNGGVEFHTVTSDDLGRPFDVSIDAGKDATVTFNTPGTFRYHCGIHPQMQGVVLVCEGACR